jgi:hypothetical protein
MCHFSSCGHHVRMLSSFPSTETETRCERLAYRAYSMLMMIYLYYQYCSLLVHLLWQDVAAGLSKRYTCLVCLDGTGTAFQSPSCLLALTPTTRSQMPCKAPSIFLNGLRLDMQGDFRIMLGFEWFEWLKRNVSGVLCLAVGHKTLCCAWLWDIKRCVVLGCGTSNALLCSDAAENIRVDCAPHANARDA